MPRARLRQPCRNRRAARPTRPSGGARSPLRSRQVSDRLRRRSPSARPYQDVSRATASEHERNQIMNDFLNSYSRYLEAVAKANALNKPLVFDALAAAGLTLVEV